MIVKLIGLFVILFLIKNYEALKNFVDVSCENQNVKVEGKFSDNGEENIFNCRRKTDNYLENNCEIIKSFDNEKIIKTNEIKLEHVIEKLYKKVNNSLEDIQRRTSDVTQNLQANIVEILNRGREKLFQLKENLLQITENDFPSKCNDEVFHNSKKLIEETKQDLNLCRNEIFQLSTEYREKLEDGIDYFRFDFENLKLTIDDCLNTKNVEPTKCFSDQEKQFNSSAKGLISELDNFFHSQQEKSFILLDGLVNCNKESFKKAEEAKNHLKTEFYDCIGNK